MMLVPECKCCNFCKFTRLLTNHTPQLSPPITACVFSQQGSTTSRRQAHSILLAIHADDDGLNDQRRFLSNNQTNRHDLPNAVIKSINLTVTIDRRTYPFIGDTTQVMPATYNSAAERNKNAQVITDRPLTNILDFGLILFLCS